MKGQKTHIKIGIDEAGRGPWAWPVVASAVCFLPWNTPEPSFLSRLVDSKTLSEKQRETLFAEILERAVKGELLYGVGITEASKIDQLGIREATRSAMQSAIDQILPRLDRESIQSIVIDGRDNFSFTGLPKDPVYIVGGDTKVREISAASIIAKVHRDHLMWVYDRLYPGYGFSQHKGYGTAAHARSLDVLGVCPQHRKTYAPIRRILQKRPQCLLHVCCWPDATVPIMDLKEKYDLTCFWYDPNIQPKAEYDKRLEAFKKVCDIEGVKWIEGEYDVKRFFSAIKGLEQTPERGEKCTVCYDMRLERSAKKANELGIEVYTSTLNTSPHKDLKKMFTLGDTYAEKYRITFLKIPFRKNGGFDRSVAYTHEHDIYRQDYCGCVYSDTFPWRIQSAKKRAQGWSG